MPYKFESEQELAKVAVDHLENRGWEVWQEVQIYSGTPIADIVAIKDDELLILECKRSFGYRLISDAMNWLGYADRVGIVYPRRVFGDKGTDRAAMFMLSLYRIEEWKAQRQFVLEPPKKEQLNSASKSILMEVLRDEHKQWAKAGSQNARRVSDFQITAYHLAEYVSHNPGKSLKEVIPSIKHHYASDNSAYGALSKLIESNNVRGVRGEGTGRSMKLFPIKEDVV